MYEPIFPGFDPFIEDQFWAEFHNMFIAWIRNELARFLTPTYSVRAESYIHLMRPDVSVFQRSKPMPLSQTPRVEISPATKLINLRTIQPDEPPRIEIYNALGKLVTVIELLSPSNKSGESHQHYLKNRAALLATDCHLVEIDLLRGGKRLESDFPQEGYVVLVARAVGVGDHIGEVFEIGLRDPLPVIPIPLESNDPDAPLNLAVLFRDAYHQASYRLDLNYQRRPQKKFSPDDQAWIEAQLKAAFGEGD